MSSVTKWKTKNLWVRTLPEAGWWKITKALIFIYDSKELKVPVGFTTDLASVPRVLRSFVTINGIHRRAAVLHDWLYSNKMYTRKECDKIFKLAMLECGCSGFVANTMYLGVRAGGWTRGRW
jgi:hypothetical protein